MLRRYTCLHRMCVFSTHLLPKTDPCANAYLYKQLEALDPSELHAQRVLLVVDEVSGLVRRLPDAVEVKKGPFQILPLEVAPPGGDVARCIGCSHTMTKGAHKKFQQKKRQVYIQFIVCGAIYDRRMRIIYYH
eukprot:scaffold680179_cov57-Prasinocladus_malaysianus.AAC.1